MQNSPPRSRWRIIPVAATGTLILVLVLVIATLLVLKQQTTIERAAERIFDVAIPQVFEATRMVRGLERLARTGQSILWINDAGKRAELRSELESIAADGSLQGNPELRAMVTEALNLIDRNLEELARGGPRARAATLVRRGAGSPALV